MATLVRWQPWSELAGQHTEMSRLINGLFEGNGRTTQAWVPAVDMWETDDEFVFAFDLPGIPEDKISVELRDGAMTVKEEREKKEEHRDDRFYRFERRYGTFTRTIALPQGVSEDSVKAEYKDGVLEVRVPKPEQSK